MEIRFARREELGQVHAIRRQVHAIRRQVHALHAKGRPDIFRPEFGQAMEDYLAARFEGGGLDVVVAVLGDEILGYATVEQVEKPASPYNVERRYYHIEEFGVARAHRRKGVATALMDFLRQDARRRGLPRIELDMWEFNREALAFYESAGFSTFRRHLELPVE